MGSQMCPFCISSHLPNSSTRCLDFKNKGTEMPRIYLGLVASKEGYSNHLILWLPPWRNQKRPRKLGSVNPGEPRPLGASENDVGMASLVLGFGSGRESTWPSTFLGEALEDCFWINWSHWEKILFITFCLIQCSAQNLVSSQSQGQ